MEENVLGMAVKIHPVALCAMNYLRGIMLASDICAFFYVSLLCSAWMLRSKVGIPGKTEGVIFTPIPCEVVYFEPERVGVEFLKGARAQPEGVIPVLSDFHQIER